MTTTAPAPAATRPTQRPRAATPAWWRDAAGLVVAAGLLVVVASWVSRGGIQTLYRGPGEALTSAGRLTGLVAADLLLVQVGLMARIPWVERSIGQDRLTRWHRWLGFSSFTLLMAHVVLITLGYAAQASGGVLATAWDLVWSYPGMLLATAGTAAIVMVVVTSARAARRRLRHESWHLIHLYAYLGVGLGLPHQVWTGDDFVSRPWSRLYWWTLYAVVVGAVLVFRVGLPAWRTLRHRVTVAGVVVEGPGVVSVHLTGRALDRTGARAGQFFQLRFLDGPGWSRAHPFSLSAAPRHDALRITARDFGDGSARLATLRPGTRVLLEGPYGRLTEAVRTRDRLTFMACGIGITPLRAMLEELDFSPGEATLVYRSSRPEDAVLAGEIAEIARRRGVSVHHLVGPRSPVTGSWAPASAGARTVEAEAALLRDLVPAVTDSDVYVCGPEQWMTAVRRSALAAGVPGCQVHLEHFAY